MRYQPAIEAVSHFKCGCSIAAFSRHLSRCYPLSYRLPLLHWLCADDLISAQWTVCVPSRPLQTLRREYERKGRCAGRDHAHLQALVLPGYHSASVEGTVTAQLRFLLSRLFLDMKHDATDRFMRDTKLLCNRTKWFVVLHHTMHDHLPVFRGNSVVRVFSPGRRLPTSGGGLVSCASS
jgi:hypothetical protein